jgi:hypothetical protein
LLNEATDDLLKRQRVRAARAARIAAGPGIIRQRASLAGLIVAIPILVGILAVNAARWSPSGTFSNALPTGTAAHREAQATLEALVTEIEAFRQDYGVIPEVLSEVGVPSRGTWRYTRRGNHRYSVQGMLSGQLVSFDSITAKEPTTPTAAQESDEP